MQHVVARWHTDGLHFGPKYNIFQLALSEMEKIM
jgi:hypothetical protein